MYNHRSERNRVDVVDLDPYGTAAPFVDGAVQCVNDGGGYVSLQSVRFILNLFLAFRAVVCNLH